MSLEHLEPQLKLTIENPANTETNSAFGPGVAALCRGVRDTGSLNASAKSMHMAYSKAWRIVKDTEAALGIQLLIRDGAHGSTLTEDGIALIAAYEELDQQVRAFSKQAFKNIISN